MSNQPTGDYRLMPWEYPPIVGGSDNDTSNTGNAYDFTNLRIQYRQTPFVTTYSGSPRNDLGVYIGIQDYTVIDTAEVSQILCTFIPQDFVDQADNQVAGRVESKTLTILVEDFTGDPYQADFSYIWESGNGLAGGMLKKADANVRIDIVNEDGEVFQTVTMGVSI